MDAEYYSRRRGARFGRRRGKLLSSVRARQHPADVGPWTCTCPLCKKARRQLQHCLLRRDREERSRRIFRKMQKQERPVYPDHIVEKGVGMLLRTNQKAGVGPVPLLNIVFDIGLTYDDSKRVEDILQYFVSKGWVSEHYSPKGATDTTTYYKLAV